LPNLSYYQKNNIFNLNLALNTANINAAKDSLLEEYEDDKWRYVRKHKCHKVGVHLYTCVGLFALPLFRKIFLKFSLDFI